MPLRQASADAATVAGGAGVLTLASLDMIHVGLSIFLVILMIAISGLRLAKMLKEPNERESEDA